MKNINGWIISENKVAHSGCDTIPCGFISKSFSGDVIAHFEKAAENTANMAENLDKIYPNFNANCGVDGTWLNNWIEGKPEIEKNTGTY